MEIDSGRCHSVGFPAPELTALCKKVGARRFGRFQNKENTTKRVTDAGMAVIADANRNKLRQI